MQCGLIWGSRFVIDINWQEDIDMELALDKHVA